jgi:hypothetical protein
MVKVPKDFQDYDDDDPKVDKHKVRYQYWNKLVLLREVLKLLRKEYMKDQTQFCTEDFVHYVRNTHGFALELNATGITDNYIIVDEKKYIVFKLKYG